MPTLVRFNPWSDLVSMHDQLTHSLGESALRNGARLPIDMIQTDEAFIVEASAAGFTPEQVEVTFQEGNLTISASRDEISSEERTYVMRERQGVSYYRSVELPSEVRPDDITASFENGILTVIVPRAEKAQPKRIVVTTGVPTRRSSKGSSTES